MSAAGDAPPSTAFPGGAPLLAGAPSLFALAELEAGGAGADLSLIHI
jgi:hypothetical protein